MVWGKSRHCPEGYGHTACMTIFLMYKNILFCFSSFLHLMFLFYFLLTVQSTSRNQSNLTLLPALTLQGRRSRLSKLHVWSTTAGGVKIQTEALNPTSSSSSSSLFFTNHNKQSLQPKLNFFLRSQASIWLCYCSLSVETFPLWLCVMSSLFSVTVNLTLTSFYFSAHLSSTFSFRPTHYGVWSVPIKDKKKSNY